MNKFINYILIFSLVFLMPTGAIAKKKNKDQLVLPKTIKVQKKGKKKKLRALHKKRAKKKRKFFKARKKTKNLEIKLNKKEEQTFTPQ